MLDAARVARLSRSIQVLSARHAHTAEPPVSRPYGNRIAVQFVINYEEGGENNVLHGDDGSEKFLSEIVGAESFPARHMSMETLYECGSRAGFWRLRRCLMSLIFRSPFTV